MNEKNPLSYKDAGVDIEQADELIHSIKSIAKRTHRPGVIAGIGGFGALFEIPAGYQQPVIVSGTDGVGTKLKLAIELHKHDTIGIDLVAMCVNDILTLGAEPLFFLDYFATGKLNNEQAKAILTGIGRGCELAGAALIGGETAEMPGMYHDDDYDLAGFCVGVVEKAKIIDGSKIKAGDIILALASSGPHSNGYSLIRKVIERGHYRLDQAFENSTLGETFLTPTRIYVKSISHLLKKIPVLGLAHITGGGLLENIPRILPSNTQAHLDIESWTWPRIFQWLQEEGNIALAEMFRTFNLGVGMIAVVSSEHATEALKILNAEGEKAWQVGTIESSSHTQPRVILD